MDRPGLYAYTNILFYVLFLGASIKKNTYI